MRAAKPLTGALLVLILLVMAGCSTAPDEASQIDDQLTPDTSSDTAQDQNGSPAPSPNAEQSDAEPARGEEPLADPSVPPVRWESCAGNLECGELAVPLDHFDTDISDGTGASWPVALVRRPATGDPLGSIIINPGGPGASGVDFVSSSFSLGSAVEERFHLVGFDPRGVGASGTVDCNVDRSQGPLPDYQPDDAVELEELDRMAETLANRCLTQASAELATLSTAQVVEDLELLRLALGEAELNFIGLSYGTYLGVAYAQRYPNNIGRLVLDGVVPPEVTLENLLLQQAAAFSDAAERLDEACIQHTLSSCPGDGFLAAFDPVLAALEVQDAGEVGPTELAMATLFALYTDELWSTYLNALVDAQTGDFVGVERLSDFFLTAVDFIPYAAYVCNDLDRPSTPLEWDGLTNRSVDVAPRFGAAIASELRVCAHWPAETQSDSDNRPSGEDWRQSVALIVGTTGDAATPLANSRQLHDELPNSALVVVEAARHTSVGASDCLSEVLEEYLLDGQLPNTVTQCPS